MTKYARAGSGGRVRRTADGCRRSISADLERCFSSAPAWIAVLALTLGGCTSPAPAAGEQVDHSPEIVLVDSFKARRGTHDLARVPAIAVWSDEDGMKVWVLHDRSDGVVIEARRVAVDRVGASFAHVGGLRIGENVVAAADDALRPGRRVIVAVER